MENQYVLASPDLKAYSFGPTDYHSALQCYRRGNCSKDDVLVKCKPIVIGFSFKVVFWKDYFCWLPKRNKWDNHVKWMGLRVDFQKVIHQSIGKGEVVKIPAEN